jgi:DNA (cytosine-5)-methyltransferase 1
MKHIGLFEGIGGFSLAAEWMGWETKAWCEINPFCQRVLRNHFPEAEGFGDIIKTDFKKYANKIDILTGGFPCQDISISGKGEGIYGIRSGLWSEYYRAIKEINPGYVVIENSTQLLRKGFEKILFDFSEIGYDAEWECISASDFGYPHIRKRLWVVAYPNVQRWKGILHHIKRSITEKNKKTNALDTQCHPFLQFEQSYSQPAVFGMADGLPKRLDVVKRLGACGNALIPEIPYEIFKAIEKYERATAISKYIHR